MMDIKTEQVTTNVHKVGVYLSVEEISMICESLYSTDKNSSLCSELNKIMKDAVDAIKAIDTISNPSFKKAVIEDITVKGFEEEN